MGETDSHKVLRRKARTGREEHVARMMTPSRAIRLALARAADDLFDLPLTVSGVQIAQMGQDVLLDQFRDEWLIVVLDGPQGALGAAAVDMDVLTALIESQTLGKVLARPAEARPSTQTDAALFAPLLDAALGRMGDDLEGPASDMRVAGYRFGARIENARMLGLLLDAPDYHLFRTELDLGGGAKQGEMILAFPDGPRMGEIGDGTAGDAAQDAPDGSANGAMVLGQGALLTAEAALDAVLWRLKMPLAELENLAPGDVLTVPREALLGTRLEAGKERPIGFCRLGQINGFRAVRIMRLEGEATADRASAANEAPAGQADGETAAPRRDDGHDRAGEKAAKAAERAAAALPAPIGSGDAEAAAHSLETQAQGDPLADFPDLADLPELSLESLGTFE